MSPAIAYSGGRIWLCRLNFYPGFIAEGVLDGIRNDLSRHFGFEGGGVNFAHGAVKPHGLCRGSGDEFGLKVADHARAREAGWGVG